MPKKPTKQEQELINDLQRLRADFENYRKRVDADKATMAELTRAATVVKLLPVLDTIDRAIAHVPAELIDNKWAQGVVALQKSLATALGEMNLSRIDATPGVKFDPNLHEAVMMDETEGEYELIAEELRPGYKFGNQVVRPSMVKVTRGKI